MKLRNVLIIVSDIDRAAAFYHDLFGLQVVINSDDNVVLTEGLVLQKKDVWEPFLGRAVTDRHNAAELYFEEVDIEAFAEKLEKSGFEFTYVTKLQTMPWGQKVLRIYDPDGNLIEVGTP